AGRLRRARTVPPTPDNVPVPVRDPGPDETPGTSDDRAEIGPGAHGSASIVTEGLAEGTHRIDVALDGLLTGLTSGDAPLHGTAAGLVLVRDPRFGITFLVPGVVQAGREFEVAAVLTNTSEVPANLATLRLPGSA